MYSIDLTLTALEPMVITDGSAEGMGHACLSHIPGNMLLGAMAGAWRRIYPKAAPDDHPDFRALFLDGTVEWGHAYPLHNGRECLPTPLSLRAFKNYPGLDSGKGFAINMLHCPDQDVGQWLGDLRIKANANGHSEKTAKLGGAFFEPKSVSQPQIRKLWNMHVALDDKHRAAREGQLFGYAALAPEIAFRSVILCHTQEAAQVLLALARSCDEAAFGHARSAGYGRTALRWGDICPQALCESRVKDGMLNIFLLSDYAPLHTWQSPWDSLKQELGAHCGKFEVKNVFLEHDDIAGFQYMWQMPRTTRTVLRKGGIIRLRLAEPDRVVSLPPSIGGSRAEGYGRILLNPDFLAESFLQPKIEESPDRTDKPAALINLADPLLKVLRQRAISHLARQKVLDLVQGEGMNKFIVQVAKKSTPSQSQRGNIRRMVTREKPEDWPDLFEAALKKKTVERQWRADAPHPKTGRKDFTGDIMRDLLNGEGDIIDMTCPQLPGGMPTSQEQAVWQRLLRKTFMLELLARWERETRKQKSGDRS